MTKEEYERCSNEIMRKGPVRVQAALITIGLGGFFVMGILDRLTGPSMLIFGMLTGLGFFLPVLVKFPPKNQ